MKHCKKINKEPNQELNIFKLFTKIFFYSFKKNLQIIALCNFYEYKRLKNAGKLQHAFKKYIF